LFDGLPITSRRTPARRVWSWLHLIGLRWSLAFRRRLFARDASIRRRFNAESHATPTCLQYQNPNVSNLNGFPVLSRQYQHRLTFLARIIHAFVGMAFRG